MKILLDENFPLALHDRLRKLGHESEHIIPLRLRGASDRRILQKLRDDRYLFLTQDEDFFDLEGATMDGLYTEQTRDARKASRYFAQGGGPSVILLSRIPQRLPIEDRGARWLNAIEAYFDTFSDSRFTLFEIAPTGDILPWEQKRIRPT